MAKDKKKKKKTTKEAETAAKLKEQEEALSEGTEADAEAAGEAEVEAYVENCCGRSKTRTDKELKSLLNRLSRIEGQIRGIRKMVEQDAYCVDILTQVSAATCAMNSFSKVLLAEHIKTCVKDDILAGNEEKVDELVELLQKMMK